jgi:hypothetical protein
MGPVMAVQAGPGREEATTSFSAKTRNFRALRLANLTSVIVIASASVSDGPDFA